MDIQKIIHLVTKTKELIKNREMAAQVKEKGIAEEILYEKKALTLAQVEKTVGKKDFAEMVGSMVVKNPGKPTLVKESDKREAITNKITAEKAFQEEQ